MTREEREQAARTLQEFYDFNKTLTPQGDSWLQADIAINRYTQEELGKALPTAIAALRGPQPDPDTGLVPCGCGGKAVVVPKDNGFYIVCDSCEVSTTQDSFFNGTGFSAQSLDDAREDWNTAMGWRVEG